MIPLRQRTTEKARPSARQNSCWWKGALRWCGMAVPFLALSCGGDDRVRPPGFDSDGDANQVDVRCEPGKTKACSTTVRQDSGVLLCRDGVRTCDDAGYWGSCEGETLKQRANPFSVDHSKFFKRFSLSAPVECSVTNPCDPGCHVFQEPGPIATPVDPGNTIDWTEGPAPTWTPPTCGVADLCALHPAPLDASCDPCVQSICANPATDHCCTDGATPGTWDQQCVNAVYLICGDGTLPGPPNGGFCDWGALSDGPMRFGNGGLSGTRIGGNGDATDEILLETAASGCSYRDIITSSRVNLRNNCAITGDIVSTADVWLEASGAGTTQVSGTVISGGRLDLRNNVQVLNGATATGNLDLAASPNTFIEGDVWVGGTVTLGGNSQIRGDARSVGNMTGQAGSQITGSALVNTGSSVSGISVGMGTSTGSVPVPPLATLFVPRVAELDRDLDAACAAADAKPSVVQSTGERVLSPGIYGDHNFQGADLVLRPGNYVFRSLEFRWGADIRFELAGVPLADAKWDISTCGNFVGDLSASFTIDGTGGAQPDSDQLIIYSESTANTPWIYTDSAIHIGSNTDFRATLIAPHGRVFLGNNVTMEGFMWGAVVYTETSTTFNQDGAADCEMSDLWGAECGGVVLYDDGFGAYAAGDTVNFSGQVYECIDAANCNVGGGYDGGAGFWPGRGADWMSAWTRTSACLKPVLPDPTGGGSGPLECPVDVGTAPSLWATPCATGRDCQVDHRCDNVATGASCGHSKCVAGGFLPLGCDPCVDLLCDPDGDGTTTDPCCTDTGSGSEWDEDCVDRVQTECDASCGFNGGCEHDLCTEGGGIETVGCHPCVAEVCAARPSCCAEDGDASSDEWDAECVELVLASCGTEGESICEFAVFGSDNVQTGDDCVVSGGSLGGDTNGLYLQYGCSVTDVYAASQVVLYDTQAGDVYSTAAITPLGTTSTATQHESMLLNLPDVPTRTFSCGTDPDDDQDFAALDGTHPLAPGTYRNVALADDAAGAPNALELEAGIYHLESLELGDDTRLILPDSGTVELNVCGSLQLGERVIFEAAGGSLAAPDALRMRIYANGTSDVLIGEGSMVYGVFVAPNATLSLSAPSAVSSTTLVGMAWAQQVQVHRNAVVDSTGLTGAACHAAGLGEGPAAVCPVTTPLGSGLDESGMCVENLDEVEPYCAGVDLTLGAPCEESIPLCNRGGTDFTGSVDLTVWPEVAKQMATESPDVSQSIGTCTFTGTIPSGSCVTHDCASTGLLTETRTVMINAPDSMGNYEVSGECSVLDNWTVFTTGQACAGVCLNPPCASGLQSEVVIEDYQAVCPEDMAAKWVTLGWDVTRTGDADVLIEGVTTQPGGNTAYTTLAQASVNGDVCAWNDAACAVDLAALLGLQDRNHPDTIYLRITLTPDGADTATLNDWDVTYSCEYDQ